MAIEKIQITPEGTNDYGTILHPETSADVVQIVDAGNKFTATNVEGALNELFQNVNDGKTVVASAITTKGVTASPADTFPTLATKIGQITTQSVLTGNATTAQVLSGNTFYSNNPTSKLTGTMPNIGNYVNDMTRHDSKITLASGYYSGGTITSNITNLSAANIKNGTAVGAITGTYKGLGNATAAQVLATRTFSTATLSNTTGTMTNRGAVTNTISTQGGSYTIPSGYHSGSGKVTASFSNLVAGNIKSGVNIGGVVGNYSGDVIASAGGQFRYKKTITPVLTSTTMTKFATITNIPFDGVYQLQVTGMSKSGRSSHHTLSVLRNGVSAYSGSHIFPDDYRSTAVNLTLSVNDVIEIRLQAAMGTSPSFIRDFEIMFNTNKKPTFI